MEENQKVGVIDRIEGDFVVIVVGRESQTIPRSDLPSGIKEGDSVDLLTYEINRIENKRRKFKVRKLLQRIFR